MLKSSCSTIRAHLKSALILSMVRGVIKKIKVCFKGKDDRELIYLFRCKERLRVASMPMWRRMVRRLHLGSRAPKCSWLTKSRTKMTMSTSPTTPKRKKPRTQPSPQKASLSASWVRKSYRSTTPTTQLSLWARARPIGSPRIKKDRPSRISSKRWPKTFRCKSTSTVASKCSSTRTSLISSRNRHTISTQTRQTKKANLPLLSTAKPACSQLNSPI